MSSPDGHEDVTLLMIAAADGDQAAADRLLPLVFDQLRRAAHRQLANERPGHTLSATALVHEAYLKLAGPREVAWAGRGHFYVAAAEAMRRILVDHARARDEPRTVRLWAGSEVDGVFGAPGDVLRDGALLFAAAGARNLLVPERAAVNNAVLDRRTLQAGTTHEPAGVDTLDRALHVVSGRLLVRWGPDLESSVEADAGDFVYVPAAMPYLVVVVGAEAAEVITVRSVREGREQVTIATEE